MALRNDNLKAAIKELLNRQSLAVLATNAGSSPYTSLVGFLVSQDLKEIYFATLTNTHKYHNIIQNRQISLLIDSRTNKDNDFQDASAITILGSAAAISGTKLPMIKSVYLNKFSYLRDFINNSQCAVVRVAVSKYILVQNFKEAYEIIGEDL